MKVLVTGGAGYLGGHVVKHLRESGDSILVVDDFSTGHKAAIEGVAYNHCDIGDGESLSDVFQEFRPDAVIHLAALATLPACEERPDDCERINVEGTRYVLEAMKHWKVPFIAFASSCAVYAEPSSQTAFTEDAPLAPASFYGRSKQAGETMIREYEAYGIRHAIFRLYNIAGAAPDSSVGELHFPETHLLPLIILTLFGHRESIAIYGEDYPTPDGTAIRDYVHVWEAAQGFRRGLVHLEKGGSSCTLNLGSGTGTSVRSLIATVEQLTQKTVPIVLKERRAGDTAYLVSDNKQLEKSLGWQPQAELDEIVRTAWNWHLKHIQSNLLPNSWLDFIPVF